MRLDNVRTVIIIAVVGLLAVAGLLAFLAVPAYQAALQTKDRLTETENQILAQYNSRQKLSETVDRIKTAREVLGNLKAQFLPKGRELDLITAVEAAGDKHGVATKLRIDRASGLPGLAEYDRSFDLTLTGTYPNISKTLAEFERLPFLTEYDALVLNSGGGGSDPAATLTLRGLIAAPPKNL